MHIAVSQFGYWGSQVELGVLLPCCVASSEMLENGILFELKVKKTPKCRWPYTDSEKYIQDNYKP